MKNVEIGISFYCPKNECHSIAELKKDIPYPGEKLPVEYLLCKECNSVELNEEQKIWFTVMLHKFNISNVITTILFF